MNLFGKEGYAYHGAIRKYTVMFGSLFSDVMLMRDDQWIKLPLRFGSGNLYEKLPQNAAERDQTRVREILPSMSFYITDITRDPTRQTNPHNTLTMGAGLDIQARIPYNITFELAVRNKNMEDHLQILEQFAMVFDPTYTVKIKPVDSEKIENVVVVLEQFSVDDNAEQQVEDGERRIETTYVFTVKGYVYKAMKKTDVVNEVVFGTGTGAYDLTQSLFVADKPGESVIADYAALANMIETGLVETTITNPDVVNTTQKPSKRKARVNK